MYTPHTNPSNVVAIPLVILNDSNRIHNWNLKAMNMMI